MTTPPDETTGQPQPEGVVEPPFICEGSCGRAVELEWHCISEDHHEVSACSSAGGQGWWLCRVCHASVHAAMDEDPEEGSARRSVAVFTQRAAAIVAPGRLYRRSSAESGQD